MEGNGFVELSDEEVATLVNLIKENHTTNVEELHLQERFSELFDKLDTAYYEIIHDAILYDALMEDFRNGYIEYDEEELMDYCEMHCGFKNLRKRRRKKMMRKSMPLKRGSQSFWKAFRWKMAFFSSSSR